MGTWLSSPKPSSKKAQVVVDLDDAQTNKNVLSKQRSTRNNAASPLGSQQTNQISSSKTPRTDMGNFILTSNKNLNDSMHKSRRLSNAQAVVQDIRRRQSGQSGSKQSSGQNSAKNSGQNSARNSAKNSAKNSPPRTPPSPKIRQESGLFNGSSHGAKRNSMILSMKLDMLDNGYVDPPTNVHGMNNGNFILSPSASVTNPFDLTTTLTASRGGSVSSASNAPPSLKLNSTIEALLQSPIPMSARRDSAGTSPLNSARRDSKQFTRRDSKTGGSISTGIFSDKDRGSFDRNANTRYQKSSLVAIESGVDLSTMVNNGLI